MQTTLNQAKTPIIECLKHKIVPFLHSSPAIGKSSLAKQIADEYKLKLVDLRLTECDPTDISGLPFFEKGIAQFMPFDTFPIETTPLPKDHKGWLVLLDEFNSATPAVQAAAYKLILDRMVGQYKLHDKAAIIACGNLDTDNAITYSMSSALVSRFAHFYIEVNNEEWQQWAIANDIDYRITSFLNFRPELLYTFDPDASSPYASPRTWEMLSKIIKGKKEINTLLSSALIGDGVTSEFSSYTALYKELPAYQKIIANPSTVAISDKLSVKWALLSLICYNFNEDTAKASVIFLQRLPLELQVCALRQLNTHNITSYTNSEIMKWCKKLSKEVFTE